MNFSYMILLYIKYFNTYIVGRFKANRRGLKEKCRNSLKFFTFIFQNEKYSIFLNVRNERKSGRIQLKLYLNSEILYMFAPHIKKYHHICQKFIL